MKTLFFKNESEFIKYAEDNGIEYATNRLKSANDEKAYFEQFKTIPGCEVGYAYECGWELNMCIVWRGTMMITKGHHYCDEKTYAFELAEPMDWQGITAESTSYDSAPQKIGKPTAKKLDYWRNWLLAMRKKEEQQRDKEFAQMMAKIEQVCEQFPEARKVKWENGYWTFEKECNLISYCVQINSNGSIYEKLDLSLYGNKYLASTSEIAARMMKNDMQGVKQGKDWFEVATTINANFGELVNKFIGGRPIL